MNEENESNEKQENASQAPSLWQVTQSVLYAMLGVQKSKNYERDFTHGKPSQYIIVGLVAVAIFIGILVTVVKVVMSFSGT